MDDASNPILSNEFKIKYIFNDSFNSNFFIFIIILVLVFVSMQTNQDSIKFFTLCIFIALIFIIFIQIYGLKNKFNKIIHDKHDSPLDPWFHNLELAINQKNINDIIHFYNIIQNSIYSDSLLHTSDNFYKLNDKLDKIIMTSAFLRQSFPYISPANTFINPNYDISSGIPY
jgi:c-di-AMP phosphodiesterase-like protein